MSAVKGCKGLNSSKFEVTKNQSSSHKNHSNNTIYLSKATLMKKARKIMQWRIHKLVLNSANKKMGIKWIITISAVPW